MHTLGIVASKFTECLRSLYVLVCRVDFDAAAKPLVNWTCPSLLEGKRLAKSKQTINQSWTLSSWVRESPALELVLLCAGQVTK
jgi:hypothetical protein